MRIVELYNMLKDDADVTIWTEYKPAEQFSENKHIRRISTKKLTFPITGTLVFIGFYYYVGKWSLFSLAQRRIILCNTQYVPDLFQRFLRQVSCNGLKPVELAFAGTEVAKQFGHTGPVLPSPIDLSRFVPRPRPREDGDFRVGRMSRDTEYKHHPEAVSFYRRLSVAGVASRIMGGTVLQKQIPDPIPGLELLPHGAENAVAFLQSLDCFFYRTDSRWFETYGRVIFEAMACGLPVVAHREGGYAEFVTNGEDALLFDTDDEAFAHIERLRNDPEYRARIGASARRRVESIYGDNFVKQTKDFLLR